MNAQYIVTKANVLITARYKLTVEEQRIILILISLLQPQDEDFKPYTFRISNFMELLGIDTKTKYTTIPKITKGLMKKELEIYNENELIQAPWLAGAKYNKQLGTVELLLSPYLKPYLLSLKSRFTTYPLQQAIQLMGTYTVRFYELLQSIQYKQSAEIKLLDLINMFQIPTTYSDYAQIKRRVLKPAQEEINEKTDIQFTYETITERKKVVALKFHIKANPKNVQKQKSTLPASTEPLEHPSTGDEYKNEKDISDIKRLFQHNYKSELVDKFVREMIEKKGSDHVYQCLTEFRKYIEGQDIRNVAGLFYTFVIDGLVKPVSHKGKVSQRDNFDQREHPDEYYDQFYANLQDEPVSQPEPKNEPEAEQKIKPSYEDVKEQLNNLRSAIRV